MRSKPRSEARYSKVEGRERSLTSGWLEMINRTSIFSAEIDCRNRRSFRQCPILETMMQTRVFWPTSTIEKSMESGEAVSWKLVRRSSIFRIGGEVLGVLVF